MGRTGRLKLRYEENWKAKTEMWGKLEGSN
jgi:hypothetical protein